MEKLSSFCPCDSITCPNHPTNHNMGCTPCIEKNLRTGEIPSCFFQKLPNAKTRKGDYFLDFAKLVFENENIEVTPSNK